MTDTTAKNNTVLTGPLDDYGVLTDSSIGVVGKYDIRGIVEYMHRVGKRGEDLTDKEVDMFTRGYQ